MNLNDYARSIIRTVVPLMVGSAAGWLASRGVEIDRTQATVLLDLAFSALFYAVVRAAERRWPQAGWLLGAPGAPAYPARPTGPSQDAFDAVFPGENLQ